MSLLALALLGLACAPQHPDEPLQEILPERTLYAERYATNDERYHTGTDLGYLAKPPGPVRRVTWFIGYVFDFQDWEKRIVLEYDRAGRLTGSERWSLGVEEGDSLFELRRKGSPPGPELAWTFDDRGRPLSGRAGSGRAGPEDGILRTIDFTYDDASGRIAKTHTVGNLCRELAYADVDGDGRIVRVVELDRYERPLHVAVYVYADDGRLTFIQRPGNVHSFLTWIDYDPAGNPSRMVTSCSSGDVDEIEWLRDETGRICGELEVDVPRESIRGAGRTGQGRERRMLTVLEGPDAPLLEDDTRDGADESLATYEHRFDARGNWTVRRNAANGEGLVRREIEYWD